MGRGTLREVVDRSGDSRGGSGMVGGPLGRSWMGWRAIGELWDVSGNPGEVQDGSGNHQRGLGRVGGPSERSETGLGTLR